MPKAQEIFSIKKIKEEKLPNPGKRDHPITRGIQIIRKEHHRRAGRKNVRAGG